MDARREAQRISGICASLATTQTRFLAATQRDGASWAHFCVACPRHTAGIPSVARLELRPIRRRRIRDSKSGRLLVRFASLGSGSEGNGLVVEAGTTRVLVDCGFGV